jgi:hypothetical protein
MAANNNFVRAETAEVVRSYGQNIAVTDGSRGGYGGPIVGVSSMLSNSQGNGSIIHNAQQLSKELDSYNTPDDTRMSQFRQTGT